MKTIVLTGGHMAPAVSIAEEFKKRSWRVVVIGRAHAFSEASDKPSLEKSMMEATGVEFHAVNAKRFPSSLQEYITYFPALFVHVLRIKKKLQEIKPDRVLTFGGYVSAPVALASYLLGIPFFIHDQTVRAGRANKILAFLARNIFISWKETRKDFPSLVQDKVVLTGNPVRTLLRRELKPTPDNESMQIYITGGSTGSHVINMIVDENLEKLLEHFTLVHQCGDSQFNDYDVLRQKAEELPAHLKNKYTVTKYVSLNELPTIFEKSHVIIGRSGANTVVEIALHAKIAVFIPLPLAQYNEQEVLAAMLEKSGSALVLPQKELTGEKLVSALLKVKENYHEFAKNAENFRQSQEIARHARAHGVIFNHIEQWSDTVRS